MCTIKTTINSSSVEMYSYNENNVNYIQKGCNNHKSLRTMCSTSLALVRPSKLQDFAMKKCHLLNAIRKKFNVHGSSKYRVFQRKLRCMVHSDLTRFEAVLWITVHSKWCWFCWFYGSWYIQISSKLLYFVVRGISRFQ